MPPIVRRPRVFACAAIFVGAGISALSACSHETNTPFDANALHAQGEGRYSTELLAGERGPSNRQKGIAKPKVTSRFQGPPSTNDWWSSLIWDFDGIPYSRAMYPHPLAVRADAEGLGVSYPSEAITGPREYRFPYSRDLRIGINGLKAPDTRVDSWSDWAVTAAWQDGARTLRTTIGHGLPFVYAHVEGGDAKVDLSNEGGPEAPKFWSEKGEVVGLTIRGHHYGVFGPTGSTWRHEGAALLSNLNGKDFFSVAVLPDNTPETLELFRTHAYAFVTGTDVSWKYDAKKAQVVSTFAVKTSLVEAGPGRVDVPILALYPHQWKATHAPLGKPAYTSARGPMKLLEASTFDVERAFHGVLPILPDAGTYDRGSLASLVHDSAGEELFPIGLEGQKDSYWAGKSLGKVSTLVWLADQLGDTDTSTRLVKALEKELENWFDGRPPYRFYYDSTWRTLIGLPAGYQSGTELNDHHFHYGYFVMAAATIAAHDKAWGKADHYGSIVQLLIKDVANWDRADERFPRLRSFDAYAGHSWASGAAMFEDGNNEESSSEDLNFATALVLWGNVTGDATTRDLGAFLYETTISAVEQYWFDVDKDVYPKGYNHPIAGIVWGDGVKYNTWWDRNAIYIHGINVLPVTGGSLYLGRRPDAVHADYAHLLQSNRGPVHQWRDVIWEYLALDDAKAAETLLDDDHAFEPEFGNSWASVSHWIRNLSTLGHVDASVLADTTSYAVFRNARGERTYAAYNPTASNVTVTFSDGAKVDVPAGAMRHATHQAPAPAPAPSAAPSTAPAAVSSTAPSSGISPPPRVAPATVSQSAGMLAHPARIAGAR